MDSKDFRDYLDGLEKQGMLLRVKKQARPRFEIAAANGLPTLGKWGIDATAPLSGEPFGEGWLYKKALPPGIDQVDCI